MFGECHAHALMNSVNYRAAVKTDTMGLLWDVVLLI